MEKKAYIDFRSIKQQIPIDRILSHYGVQTRRISNVKLVARCPLPTHKTDDTRQTFAVNTDRNLWYCHSDSCKKGQHHAGGNTLDLVQAMEGGIGPYDAASRLIAWFPAIGNGSGNPATSPNGVQGGPSGAKDSHSPSAAAPQEPEVNKPLAFVLKDVNPEHPMIQERGISIETAKLYGVGFFPGKGSMAGRIVFPLHEAIDGRLELIGYAGRFVGTPDAEHPKWKLPAGLHKTFCYGLEKCDPHKPLILTESLWAPLFFHEKGMQAASLMGTEMAEAQEITLAAFKVIWLAFDNDEKGREATEKVAARLRRNHAIKTARLRE